MIYLLLMLVLLQEPNIDAVPADGKPSGAAKELLDTPAVPKADVGATKPAEPPPVVRDGAPQPAAATNEPQAAAPANSAAESSAGKPPEPWYIEMMSYGLMGYMIKGGIFMWPIFILGILAIGVIIERYRSLNLLQTDTTRLRQEVLDLLTANKIEEALQVCDQHKGPVPAMLSQGLRKLLVMKQLNYDPAKIEEQVIKAMDDYGMHIVGALERHLPILATVSSVAPMIGFLGTVQGMVTSFEEMVLKADSGEPIIKLAAEGIMVSLLTTVLGLIVGIPAFMAFNYFNTVINRYVLDVEESASELIETVTLQMTLDSRNEHAPVTGEAARV